MKHLKHLRKRGLAMFLALVMCLGLVQVTAFAEEETIPDEGNDPVPCACGVEGCTCAPEACGADFCNEPCEACAAKQQADKEAAEKAAAEEAARLQAEEEAKRAAEEAEAAAKLDAAKATLAEMIAGLPAPDGINPEDGVQVEQVYSQIAEIYALAAEYGLGVEDNETINAVIAALYPVETLDETKNMSGICGAPTTDSVYWELTPNNGDASNPTYTLTISGNGAMADYSVKMTQKNDNELTAITEDNRPWKDSVASITESVVTGNVTHIGDYAFAGMTQMTEYSIGSNVSSLGTGVYQLSGLAGAVSIPSNVREMGDYVFARCKNITSADLSGYTISYIPIGTFDFCGLTAFPVLPGCVTEIRQAAFRGNPITRVDIPATVTTLSEGHVFSKMPELTTVTGLEHITTWTGNRMFGGCPKLTGHIVLPACLTEVPAESFTGTSITGVTFAPNTTIINGGFEDCKGLTSLDIPDTCTTIGGFKGCTGLTSLIIPDSVKEIKANAFEGCTGLKSVKVGTGLNVPRSNIFKGCTSLTDFEFHGTGLTGNFRGFFPDGFVENSLETLDISNTQFTQLNLTVPNLKTINIIGCDKIQSTAQYDIPVRLEGGSSYILICDEHVNNLKASLWGYMTDAAFQSSDSEIVKVEKGHWAIQFGEKAGTATVKNGDKTVTIIKRGTTVAPPSSLEAVEATYDGKPHAVTIKSNPSEGIFPDVLTVTYAKHISGEGENAVYDNPVTTAPSDAGVYKVSVQAAAGYTLVGTAPTTTLTINRATPTITIIPSSTSLTGGGNVTLTVTGAPVGSSITVTCNNGITIMGNTATLPNSNAAYTFTAFYAGDGNHEPATASCNVTVTEYTVPQDYPTYTPPFTPTYPTDGGTGTTTPPSTITDNPTPLDPGTTITDDETPLDRLPLLFRDVADDMWYHDAVAYVFDRGLMKGINETTFAPTLSTERGMIVTILHRLEGEPSAAASAFTDVAAGEWYTDAVAWGAANGVVKGYSDTIFKPTQDITREQLAAILYRYAQLKGYDTGKRADLSAYTDAGDISAYALEAMQWAVAEELISGVTSYTLVPGGRADRAQVAMILMRFCENIAENVQLPDGL